MGVYFRNIFEKNEVRDEKQINKRKKIGVLVICVIALFMMGRQDYNIVKRIQAKSVEESVSFGYGSAQIEVGNGAIESKFFPVAKKIQTLSIYGTFNPEKGETVQCQIIDGEQNVLYQSGKELLTQAYNSEKGQVVFKCDNATFEEGKVYTLRIVFDIIHPVNIWFDEDGIVCAQQYIVDYQNFLYAMVIIVNILAIGFVLAFMRWKWNDKIFLAMSLTVGILAVVLTIPFARDDEFRHFVRAYDLATDGEFYQYTKPQTEIKGVVSYDANGEGPLVELPKQLDSLRRMDYFDDIRAAGYVSEINLSLCLPKLHSMLQQPEKDETVWASEIATAGRTIYGYWPQVLMIKLGRGLGVRSVFLYYFACIGQVIAVSVIMWISMRLVETKSNMIWFVSFIPVSVMLFASANSDGLMIAEVVLCLSIILHIREQEYHIRDWHMWVLGAIYLFIVYNIFTNKFPYALLCLGFLPLLIKKKPSKKVVLFTIVVLVTVVFVLICQRDAILETLYKFLPQEYIVYWMSNFKVVSKMMIKKGLELLLQTWQAVGGGRLFSYSILAVCVLLLSKRGLGWIQKLYACLLFLLMLGVIVVVGYTLTPPDYGQIWGVTFRYILPFLPVAAIVIPMGTETTEIIMKQYYPILFIGFVFSSLMGFGII